MTSIKSRVQAWYAPRRRNLLRYGFTTAGITVVSAALIVCVLDIVVQHRAGIDLMATNVLMLTFLLLTMVIGMIHGRWAVSERKADQRKQTEQALRDADIKMRLMLDAVAEAVIVTDVDSTIRQVNSAALAMAGCQSESAMVGHSALEFVTTDDRERVRTDWAKTLALGQVVGAEYRLVANDGGEILAELSCCTMKNAAGLPTGVIIVVQDVTRRKHAERALEETDTYLKNIFNSVLAGIVVIDAQSHTVTDANDLAARLVGHPKEAVIGASCNDYICAGNRDICPMSYRLSTVDNIECKIQTRNGETIDVLKSIVPIMRNGREQLLETFIDISEHKRAEEMYHTLANSSPIGVYIAQDGKFTFVNPQFQKILGYDQAELLRMNPLELVHPQDREIARQSAIEMLKGKRASPYEFRVVGKNGDPVWALENVTSILYKGRRATLGNFTDVTERKKMEEQLIRSDRLASIGELASGIAHELNNPLTGVIGFSQLLMDSDVPENIREDLNLVCKEAQRAADIIKNLLTFARKHPSVRQPTRIEAAIDEVLKLRAYEQKVNNIEVRRAYEPGLPEVVIDYFQMQQVFLNIIVNAEYFMIQAHSRGSLTINAQRLDGHVRVSFTDDGPGIPPRNLTRIFDPFFTTKEVGKGTGLGLSICHGIVTEHGGRIWAASGPGQGATIAMELPLDGYQQLTHPSPL